MNLSGFTSLHSAICYADSLATLAISNTQAITNLIANTNNLTSAQVDAILVALDGNGLNGGTVDLSGQTPSAPPTGTGRTAAASLVGKGWTVTVDEIAWAPVTEIVAWSDSGGADSGNLAYFIANADFDTVSQMTFGATGNLTALTGLQCLIALATLDCNTNALSALDCTGITSLTTLNCSLNTSLTTLTMTGCSSLSDIDCSECDITGTLNVSPCSVSLTSLQCYLNANLSGINLTGCSMLTTLDCANCSISVMDLTNCPLLTFIDAGANLLVSMDVHLCTSLAIFVAVDNLLTSLDISSCPLVSALGVSGNPNMTSLDISGTQIVTIDASFGMGSLVSLDASGCVSLTQLTCLTNQLTSINVTGCTAMTNLDCSNNKLVSLDVSTCSALSNLSCFNNRLTALDVSMNPIKVLDCHHQYSGGVPVLVDLRIGNSAAVVYVEAEDNALPTGPNGVDDVLNKLATNCLANLGYCDLDTAATNSSPTGGLLNADYVALTGAGWTVTIN